MLMCQSSNSNTKIRVISENNYLTERRRKKGETKQTGQFKKKGDEKED